jgi:peptidylprolyl isomerase
MKKKHLICITQIVTLSSCNGENSNLQMVLYAKIETRSHYSSFRLSKAPITVANFVTLAEGKNDFVTNDNLKAKPF